MVRISGHSVAIINANYNCWHFNNLGYTTSHVSYLTGGREESVRVRNGKYILGLINIAISRHHQGLRSVMWEWRARRYFSGCDANHLR
jgi:hypothetical protein